MIIQHDVLDYYFSTKYWYIGVFNQQVDIEIAHEKLQ